MTRGMWSLSELTRKIRIIAVKCNLPLLLPGTWITVSRCKMWMKRCTRRTRNFSHYVYALINTMDVTCRHSPLKTNYIWQTVAVRIQMNSKANDEFRCQQQILIRCFCLSAEWMPQCKSDFSSSLCFCAIIYCKVCGSGAFQLSGKKHWSRAEEWMQLKFRFDVRSRVPDNVFVSEK